MTEPAETRRRAKLPKGAVTATFITGGFGHLGRHIVKDRLRSESGRRDPLLSAPPAGRLPNWRICRVFE